MDETTLNSRLLKVEMGVSKNSGTPKSSILIRFSLINHPFWGTTIFGNTQMSMVFQNHVHPPPPKSQLKMADSSWKPVPHFFFAVTYNVDSSKLRQISANSSTKSMCISPDLPRLVRFLGHELRNKNHGTLQDLLESLIGLPRA